MSTTRAPHAYCLFLFASGLFLQACGEKTAASSATATMPPPIAVGACSHPDTIATVTRLFVDNAGGGPFMSDPESVAAARRAFHDGTAALSVEAIRTVSRDQSLGRSECNAQMRLGVAPGTFERLTKNVIFAATIGSAGWKRDGQTLSVVSHLAYSSQFTDDRKHVYIQLDGANALIQGAALLAVASSVAKSEGPPPAAPAAPSTTPATSISESDVGCSSIDTKTNAGLMECEERKFMAADATLNVAYKAAMTRLEPERQVALRAEQRTWVAGRDSGCQQDEERAGIGGTAATLNIIGCRATRTDERTAKVKAFQ